jgi:cell volume regulation protein A
MIAIEYLLMGAALLLVLSIVASKASGALGVPALVLFLLIGMLVGSDGIGGVYFDDPWTAQLLGTVALILILFSGGLDTDWSRIRPVLREGLVLATLGVVITAVVIGAFAVFLLDFGWLEGLLLGAIVSSTDAAAVFTVLQSRDVRLREPLEPLLELESGSNDPMAVFLTAGLTGILADPTRSLIGLVPMFFLQMLLGLALGYGMGRAIALLINRLHLRFDGLYPVLMLGLVLLTYAATTAVGGNGFLAAYIAGLVLANHDFLHKTSLIRFHDGLAWLMQIVMFLTLGLLVYPSRLPAVALDGLLVSLVLIFVARPLAVFVLLWRTGFSWREKALISWVGLRGAVPIIMATYPLLAGLPKADTYFNLVYFATVTSVLIQGTSIPLVARLLGVDEPQRPKTRYPLELAPGGAATSSLAEFVVPPHSRAVGRQVFELGLPKGVLIVLVSRDGQFLVPGGATELEADDTLLVFGDKATLDATRGLLAGGAEVDSGSD